MPPPRKIFVFGSNRQGRHGKGAALVARMEHGAIYGQAEGLQGNSYAIITKELRPTHAPVTLSEVATGVYNFLDFARRHPDWTFNVCRIGCGLAGFRDSEIAPLFKNRPPNVKIDDRWADPTFPNYEPENLSPPPVHRL